MCIAGSLGVGGLLVQFKVPNLFIVQKVGTELSMYSFIKGRIALFLYLCDTYMYIIQFQKLIFKVRFLMLNHHNKMAQSIFHVRINLL